MKIAFCLSGHLRSYQQTFGALYKHILQPLNPDVFIHTWDFIGVSPHIDLHFKKIPTISKRKEIENIYKPKAFLVEKLNLHLGERYRSLVVDKRSPNAIVNMFYKIYQADLLRQRFELIHGKYDIVIRARADLLFEKPIDPDDLAKASENGHIYLPNCGHFDGLNDQFAFGNSEAMKEYSSCYMEISNIAKDIPFRPEVLMKEHLVKKKISLDFIEIPYTIKRINGDIFDNRFHSAGVPDTSKW